MRPSDGITRAHADCSSCASGMRACPPRGTQVLKGRSDRLQYGYSRSQVVHFVRHEEEASNQLKGVAYPRDR